MDQIAELRKCVEELKLFFIEHELNGWISRCEVFLQKNDTDKTKIKNDIINFAGVGMGALNDLYISEENGHNLGGLNEKEANQQLEILINNFYLVAKTL